MALPQAIKDRIPSRFSVGVTQPPASSLLTSFAPPATAQVSAPVAGSNFNPATIAKDILQGVARSGSSVGLTLANKPELAIDPTAPEAEQRIQRILFGDEPVKSLATRIAEGELKAKPVVGEKFALPSAIAVVGGLTIADFLPGGKAAKEATKIALSKNVDDIVKSLKGLKVSEEAIPKLAQDLVKVTDPKEVGRIISSTTKELPVTPKLKPEISNRVADEAIKVARENPGSSLLKRTFNDPETGKFVTPPRLFQRIGDALKSGEINMESLPDIVKKYGLTAEETSMLFKDAATYSGRTLQALSRVQQELEKLMPEIAGRIKIEPTAWQKFKSVWLPIDNFRRGLLVSQMATAARNIISQGGRYSLEVVNDAISGVINKVGGKPEPFAAMVEDISAIFRRTNPENLAKINKILADNPLDAGRLLNTPVGDVALGNKITNFLNTPNRFQEFFYRNLIMDAKLHTFAKQRGVEITALNSDEIARAVDQALELTFASSPKSGTFLNAVLNVWREIPPLTVLANPFPRFMANSLKFIMQHSPLGLMSLFSKESRAAIAAGDPKVISRAISGVMMLSAATAIRNSPGLGGEKWYELKVGDKTIDLRPFAPFSTYLFIAELWSNPERLTGQDFAQGALSINRIAGTGLAVVDLFQTGTPEGTIKFLKEFTGQYLGGYTVPFRTVADILGQFRPEAALTRDVKEKPILGPAMANIPFLGEKLPEYPSLYEERPFTREQPLLRQTTGITVKTKPYILKEIDRLGLQTKDFIPKTGDPTINRIITKATGTILDNINDVLENSKVYQSSSDDSKIGIIKTLISEAKSTAKGKAAKDIAQVVYDELAKEKKENRGKLVEQLKNKGLLTENILDFLVPMIQAKKLK